MDASVPSVEEVVKQAETSLYPLHYLPYGVFSMPDQAQKHIGVAIGDYVLDLTWLEAQGWLKTGSEPVFQQGSLNQFAAQTAPVWAQVRMQLQNILTDNSRAPRLFRRQAVSMHLPFAIPGYTDFYASEHHATNVGRLFRGGENALLPNWKRLPVAYNGRASTVFPSGTVVYRPWGQVKLSDQEAPVYMASQKLDYELELGIFVGEGNPDGQPIPVSEAESHFFGLVLLNDWSARDIQAYEYQPLGPFLGKSFATSISTWVVPMAVVMESMVDIPKQDPSPVSYLNQANPKLPNIQLQVAIQPRGSAVLSVLCETQASTLYWSLAQMLAHHTVNGCIMQTGDLLGTGTISGAEAQSWGSLLESTFNGKQPINLADGIQRTFLEDGDKIIMSGYIETPKGRFGMGEVEGIIESRF